MSSQLHVYRKSFFLLLLLLSSQLNIIGPHLSTPWLLSLTQKSTTFVQLLDICEMRQENTLSFSVNAVVHDAFLLRCFFYLSLTHAQIFQRSMLRILWLQRNIWCIIVATFKLIAMSSARSASVLSMVKSKHSTAPTAKLIPPLANLDHTSYPAPCKPTPPTPP